MVVGTLVFDVLLGDVHKYTGYVIVATAAGHAAMALFHRFVRHDGVLQRMLPHRG